MLGVAETEAGAAVCVLLGVEPSDGLTVPLFEGVPEAVFVTVGDTVASAVCVAVEVNVEVRVAVPVPVKDAVIVPLPLLLVVKDAVCV